MATHFFVTHRKGTYVFVLICWLLTGLYFGSGGLTRMENDAYIQKNIVTGQAGAVEYKGAKFTDEAKLISVLEDEQMNRLYPWLNAVPSYLSYILTACAFGLLGSLISIFIELAVKKRKLIETDPFSLPVLGILTGIVVLGATIIFPSILVSGEKEIKPISLMFLSLFGGLFARQFYSRLSTYFNSPKEEK